MYVSSATNQIMLGQGALALISGISTEANILFGAAVVASHSRQFSDKKSATQRRECRANLPPKEDGGSKKLTTHHKDD